MEWMRSWVIIRMSGKFRRANKLGLKRKNFEIVEEVPSSG